MIIRDPHAHASDVGKLSRELKLALDEQLRNTISRRDAFKVFEDIVSRYVSNIDSTVFHLFAERWLYKVQYMYLVETSAKPALIRMAIEKYVSVGELNLIDWAHMYLELAASHKQHQDQEAADATRQLVTQEVSKAIEVLSAVLKYA